MPFHNFAGTSALELASKIRCDVFNATGCTASAGIACNILLARMATRSAKPNGQFHLKNNEIKDFIGKIVSVPTNLVAFLVLSQHSLY